MPRLVPVVERVLYLGARAWRIMVSPRTPLPVKVMMIGGLVYCLSPYDLIPEWVPVVGVLDDVALAALIISLALRMAPDDFDDGPGMKGGK